LRDTITQLRIQERHFDAEFDAVADYNEVCEKPPSQLIELRSHDCQHLKEYLTTRETSFPGKIILQKGPDVSDYKDDEVRRYVADIARRIDGANEESRWYADNKQRPPDDTEVLYFLIAIPALAMALGLGITRRVLDAIQDWPAASGR
jgi:hypothetical protein